MSGLTAEELKTVKAVVWMEREIYALRAENSKQKDEIEALRGQLAEANAKPGTVNKEKLIKDLLFCAKSCPSTKADYIISSIITKIMRGDFDIKPGGE